MTESAKTWLSILAAGVAIALFIADGSIERAQKARDMQARGCTLEGVPDAYTEVRPGLWVKGPHWFCDDRPK